jgi:hypothetical protein
MRFLSPRIERAVLNIIRIMGNIIDLHEVCGKRVEGNDLCLSFRNGDDIHVKCRDEVELVQLLKSINNPDSAEAQKSETVG